MLTKIKYNRNISSEKGVLAMFDILVVEDNPNSRKLMMTVIKNAGYDPIGAVDGVDALDILEKKHVDLIVLDLMMPRMDGYEFTKQLRDAGWDTPILIITAKQSVADKCRGLKLGADDYMVKPVDEEEMLLRIAALLRRSRIAYEKNLKIRQTVLNYEALSVSCNGMTFELPQKEFMLLFKFLSFPSKIFTRRQLMDEIWDMDSESDERTVDVHINRLRERFRDNTDFEIVTVRGLGYKGVVKAGNV